MDPPSATGRPLLASCETLSWVIPLEVRADCHPWAEEVLIDPPHWPYRPHGHSHDGGDDQQDWLIEHFICTSCGRMIRKVSLDGVCVPK